MNDHVLELIHHHPVLSIAQLYSFFSENIVITYIPFHRCVLLFYYRQGEQPQSSAQASGEDAEGEGSVDHWRCGRQPGGRHVEEGEVRSSSSWLTYDDDD